MKNRKASMLAWTLFALIALSMVLQARYDLTKPGASADALAGSQKLLWGIAMVVFAFVAALIVSRQPRNVIGWLLMSPGVAAAIPAEAYVAGFVTAPANPTPLLLLCLWFGSWGWLLVIFPILFIPPLFPTGRPLSPRWRWLLLAGAALCAFFVLFSAFAAELGPTSSELEGVWSVPNPIGFLPVDAFPLAAWFVSLGAYTLASAASLIVRYLRASPGERAQIKWLAYGITAFALVYVITLATALDSTVSTVAVLLLDLAIMGIPVAIGVAILRYRLWDIDLIIRRTLVYVPLSALLAGVFAASIKVSQAFFSVMAGSSPEAPTVLTTLIVVAAFDPLKGWLQRAVDARFKETPDPEKRWVSFGEQVKAFVEMNDPPGLLRRLLEESVAVFEAKGGAVYINESGQFKRVHTVGDWESDTGLSVPLKHQGADLGRLLLGMRRNGRPYDANDRARLELVADPVAAVIGLRGKGVTQVSAPRHVQFAVEA